MKQTLSLILAVLICLNLVACGKSTEPVVYVDTVATKKQEDMLQDVFVGDVILFGSYEQDNVIGNGKEPIQWIVLERKGDECLVVSEQLLDVYPYHPSKKAVIWENCDLRAWLNSTFYEEAFDSAERKQIISTTVQTESVHQKYYDSFHSNYIYTDEPLSACSTNDYIYILSVDEINKYFRTEAKAIAEPTYYARLAKSSNGEDTEPFAYFTRTPGTISGSQKYIDEEGSSALGGAMNQLCLGVRPSMWLSLDGAVLSKETTVGADGVANSNHQPKDTLLTPDKICDLIIEQYAPDDIDFFDVSYADNVYIVNVAMGGTASNLLYLKQIGFDEDYESWVSVKDTFGNVYDSIRSYLDSLGEEDTDLLVNLLNDKDYENVLLSYAFGVVIYDYMAE